MTNIINKKPEGFVNPDDQVHGPNCGVTAVAIAMGISFNQSWELHKKVGKKSNKWKGSTFSHDRIKVLNKLNAKYRVYNGYTDITKYGRITKRSNLSFSYDTPITLSKYVKWNCNTTSTYIITTTGHVQVVKGGWVIDQCDSKPIHEWSGKRKYVKQVIEILPKRLFKRVLEKSFSMIYPKVKDNPRKANTFGWYSMQIILDNPDGIQYEAFIKKGGRAKDLTWDVKKGHVEWEK